MDSPLIDHRNPLLFPALSGYPPTMSTPPPTIDPDSDCPIHPGKHHFRFHVPIRHLASAFGDGWFGTKAEAFARFFGTPTFLIAQTVIVGAWITVNVVGFAHFDLYPFILLNLAFSLQAAYAAPLILLAQTRQADRDKAQAEADAQHREDLHAASEERRNFAEQQTIQLVALLQKNTELTEHIKDLSQRIESLTAELHTKIVAAQK